MYSDNDALIATVSTLRMAGNLKPRRGDILLPNKEICLNNTDIYHTDSITMANFYQLFTKAMVDIQLDAQNSYCNNFPVYYPDVYLQLNTFRAFSRPSSGAQ
jgi:hypothetical protein